MAKFLPPPLALITINAHMRANNLDGCTAITRPAITRPAMMRPAMNGKDDKRRLKTWRRELAAAWIVGGAIWMAGVGGLAAVSAPNAEGALAAVGEGPGSYLQPSRTWSTYQDPSGKYTVVVRSFRRVLAN